MTVQFSKGVVLAILHYIALIYLICWLFFAFSYRPTLWRH